MLFAAAIFVLYRLWQLIPTNQIALPQETEEEALNKFATQHELSTRERDVLAQLMHGYSNAEIAAALFVSESTVKFHMHNMFKKTGCKTRNELRGAVTMKM